MPFRRLPDSDPTRVAALDAAFQKWSTTDPAARAFPQGVYDRLAPALTDFKRETGEAASALSGQTQQTGTADTSYLALHQSVSHFIQVFNLAVARGVFPRSDRAHYQLDVSSAVVPDLSSQSAVTTWAGHLIQGEAARVAAGGPPMAMPTLAEVEVALEAYQTASASQSTAKDTFDDEQADVAALRPTVDKVILDIWDHVEFTYREEDSPSKRRKSREWGVVYVPRPGETPDPDAPTPPALPEL